MNKQDGSYGRQREKHLGKWVKRITGAYSPKKKIEFSVHIN